MSERELFEEWFECELNKHANFSTHMGIYLDVGVSAAWDAWQASANRQGYKLVPLEMSWQKADDLAMDEWNKNKELFKSQNRDLTAIQVQDFRLKWCRNKAHQIMSEYKAMIGEVGN